MGQFTDITVKAPAAAMPGDIVEIQVDIKNKWTGAFEIFAVAVVNRSNRIIDWSKRLAQPGITQSFFQGFIMPDDNALIEVYSYYAGGGDSGMIEDDMAWVIVERGVIIEAAFSDLQASYRRMA